MIIKSTHLGLCFLVVLFTVAISRSVEAVVSQDEDHESQIKTRIKREASTNRSPGNSDKQQVSIASSAAAEVSASSSSGALKPVARPSETVDMEAISNDRDEEQQFRPAKKPNRSRGTGKSRAPSDAGDDGPERNYRHNRHEDDIDCDDKEEQNGDMFQSMAANPMRHFRRMMNSVFDRISDPDFGFYSDTDDDGGDPLDHRRRGNSVASSAAAAFSSRDGGYSKLSSSVSSNGRTRGIITETRNGRTKTRRIGDDGDDGDE